MVSRPYLPDQLRRHPDGGNEHSLVVDKDDEEGPLGERHPIQHAEDEDVGGGLRERPESHVLEIVYCKFHFCTIEGDSFFPGK